ncbi:CsbD family protein [Streptomyces platensis]|uniref:CsbD family protein n=1 Tax=Streptomyces platensis TaxID=58346 RepID=UPI002E0F0F00|nr:CsbD family protein [Streptomyces platensis]
MTAADKLTAKKTKQAKGAAKETVGRAVGNERMTAEGRAERRTSELRQAAAKAHDPLHR